MHPYKPRSAPPRGKLYLATHGAIPHTVPCFLQTVVSEGEEEVIRQAFQVNFDLLAAADACSRGVDKCAHMDFKQLATVIEQTVLLISKHRAACNPIVRRVVTRTLELLSQ